MKIVNYLALSLLLAWLPANYAQAMDDNIAYEIEAERKKKKDEKNKAAKEKKAAHDAVKMIEKNRRTIAVPRLHLLQKLGRRVDDAKNYAEMERLAGFINELFAIAYDHPSVKTKFNKLNTEIDNFKIGSKKYKRSKKGDKKFMESMMQDDEFLNSPAHIILENYFRKTLLCGRTNSSGISAGAAAGVDIAWRGKYATDIFGNHYHVGSLYLMGAFSIGAVVYKGIASDDDMYERLDQKNKLLRFHYAEDAQFNAALGIGVHLVDGSEYPDEKAAERLQMNEPVIGLGFLFSPGRLGPRVKMPIPLPVWSKQTALKLMKSIDKFVMHNLAARKAERVLKNEDQFLNDAQPTKIIIDQDSRRYDDKKIFLQ